MFKIKVKKIILTVIIWGVIIFCFPNNINAVKIVLDAGHGGHDTGAINKSKGIYEKDINLKIVKYLKEYLSQYENTQVILTRSDDTFLEIYDRSMIARNQKADIMISVHMNSNDSGTVKGAEVYVSNNTSLPKYKEETTKLGNKILDNLNKLGIENRGVKTRLIKDTTDIYSDGTIADYYGIIRYAMRGCRIDSGVIKPQGAIPANVQNGEGIPAMIIEHCYLNNENDYQFIDTEDDIKKLAKADADAITEYYKLNKKNVQINNFKIEDDIIITIPDTIIEKIKEKYETAIFASEDKRIATGNKLKIDEKEYTIIKLGDTNGDGEITPADYVKVKNHIMNVSELDKINQIGADTNQDGEITPADYVKVKNHIMNVSKIEIKTEE